MSTEELNIGDWVTQKNISVKFFRISDINDEYNTLFFDGTTVSYNAYYFRKITLNKTNVDLYVTYSIKNFKRVLDNIKEGYFKEAAYILDREITQLESIVA